MEFKQERKTFDDVAHAQEELMDMVEEHLNNNTNLTFEEKQRFRRMYNVAVLSNASHNVVISYDGKRILQTLEQVKNKLCELTGSKFTYVSLVTKDGFYDNNQCLSNIVIEHMPVSELWRTFKCGLVCVFPFARQEAVQKSAEREIRPPQGSYEFSSDRRIE